jgi:hypothetical protein
MPAHCLRDIEITLATVWMNRQAREQLIFSESTGKRRDRSKPGEQLPASLLAEIDKDGVRLYAELLNLGQQDLMENVFPGCAKLIGDRWSDEVNNYLERFPPTHYNLNRAAEKFPEYLLKFGDRYLRKYPFIAELADYEWLELELLEHPGQVKTFPYQPLTDAAQFEQQRPVVNPVLAVRRYKYPITEIVEHLEDDCCLPKDVEPKITQVAVYREPETHDCRFFELGQMAARVIEAAQEKPTAYKDLIALAVSTSGGMDPQQCVLQCLEMIEKLQEVKLLVGSAPL